MTVEEVWAAVARRWLVMLTGVLLTLTASVIVWRSPGVYWASTTIYFLPPVAQQQSNQLAPDNGRALAFAGVVQNEINGGSPGVRFNDPELLLIHQGIYDGWSVRLPDYGGQWASDFRQAVLIVQASGPTEEIVVERMNELTDRVREVAVAREEAAGVPESERIGFHLSPAETEVQYSEGSRRQAVAVLMGLGFALSVAACVVADTATRRREREVLW